jgi:hypothetical protein
MDVMSSIGGAKFDRVARLNAHQFGGKNEEAGRTSLRDGKPRFGSTGTNPPFRADSINCLYTSTRRTDWMKDLPLETEYVESKYYLK